MNKWFILVFLIHSYLLSQTPDLKNFLNEVEKGNVLNLLSNNQLLDYLDSTKFGEKSSSFLLKRQLKSNRQYLLIKNLIFEDPIHLNNSDIKSPRTIFINCKFLKEVILEDINIKKHLAFIGSIFQKGLKIKRVKGNNLSLLCNTVSGGINFSSEYGNQDLKSLLFTLNSIDTLTAYSFNAHTGQSFSGNLLVKDIYVFLNKIGYFKFSGTEIKNLFLIFGNIIKTLDGSDLKLNYLLSFKFNYIDLFNLNHLMEREQALIAIANNDIGSFSIYNSLIKFMSLSNNKISTIKMKATRSGLSIHIHDNLFNPGATLTLTDCNLNRISFFNKVDSLYFAVIDTLKNTKYPGKQKYYSFREPPFFKEISKPDDHIIYLRLNRTKAGISESSKYYNLEFHNFEIDEKNWHIPFDQINYFAHRYRINAKDSSLTSRHEIYTAIYNAYRHQGKWKQADDCYYEWKEFERKNYWALADESFFYKIPKVIFHNLNWISCGYGIKPLRIFPFAVLIVFLFALFYFVTPEPISNLEYHLISKEPIKKVLNKMSFEELADRFNQFDFDFEKHKQDLIDDIISSLDIQELARILNLEKKSRFNLNYLWNCFYFSFSTFTTVGLGDWYPSGNLNRAIVMIEGALGWLSLGLFITTYANVLLR